MVRPCPAVADAAPRGYIEELPSGSYRAAVYAGIDPLTRKPRYIRRTAPTYEAAEILLTELQHEVDEDRHPKKAITVRQAVTQWMEVAELADTTRERYEDLIGCTCSRSSATCRRPEWTPSCWSGSTRGFSAAGRCARVGRVLGTCAGR